MAIRPEISTAELEASIRSRLGASVDVRVRKRQPFRIPKGGTGSYFEHVAFEASDRKIQAVLKVGRMTGPPTREALFFGRYSADSPLRTPRCYGVGQFSRDTDAWVLMEKLPRGKRLADWKLDETRDALRNLAALHAKYLGQPLPDLPRPLTEDLERWLAFVPQGARQIRGVFDEYPNLPRFASDRAFDLLLRLCDRPAVFRDAFARSPETLLHGDYHRANLIAPDSGPQVAYDWQHACAGPPVYDVAVFWSTLDLISRRGPLGLFDALDVGERCLSWDDVRLTYGTALRQLRPDADIDAIFSCADEALAWEIARQVMYMGPAMAESQAAMIRFAYKDHRTIGKWAIRLLGLEKVLIHYRNIFAEFEVRGKRLLNLSAAA